MKKKNNALKYRHLIILCIIIPLIPSCEKMVTINPPISRIVSSEVFKADETALSALYGLYASMTGTTFEAGLFLLPGMSADEIIYTDGSVSIYTEFESNDVDPANRYLESYVWNPIYNVIYQANNIIAEVKNNTHLTSSLRDQLEGEAKTIRAYCYFNLFNLFGPIPLVTSVNYSETQNLPKADSLQVYGLILEDLHDAKELLPEENISIEKTRINRTSVMAFLSRVYLYQRLWGLAQNEANIVIGQTSYHLEPDVTKVFAKNGNPETIFQLLPVRVIVPNYTLNTNFGNFFIPQSWAAYPSYSIREELLNKFSNEDYRKEQWLNKMENNGSTYYFPFKYRLNFASSIEEYAIVFRIAEQYLIHAEASVKLGNIKAGYESLDIVRKRAGLLPIESINPNIDENSLLDSIYVERQRELFTEYGHRWFDLKRSGRINAVLGSIESKNWKNSDMLYPIPFNQILANPKLKQNTGYN